ncbi:RHS repeat-associated core domain-containing protein [Pseudoxanthomonas putridarboris]|uniref:RHS repeat-associated core domain-containing protein n=1 Tax=Pseudoxanthomonas putridarboris TaxID=752605 RepID=A0ABU9IYQ2_9GAMM
MGRLTKLLVARWLLVVLAAVMPAVAGAQTTVKYVHTDALGSVVAMTDAIGAVVETTREYEPYGLQLTPAVQDGPGYTGHVQDAATGLTYMQQRYMDPQIGLFLSVDPVTAYSNPVGQFHRYRYAANNPYRFVDPDGRSDVQYNYKYDYFYKGTSRFDIPGMTTVTGHSWATGFQDNRDQPSHGPPVSYDSLKADIARSRSETGDSGYIYLGGCNLGLGNVPAKLAQDFDTKVISATGYVKMSESKNGDLTFTANSRADGKGQARWFQMTDSSGKNSGRIGSISMRSDGKVTFKAAEASVGSRIKDSVTVDPRRQR